MPFPKKNKTNQKVEMYGLSWDAVTDPLWREMYCIQKGGRWKGKNGGMVGDGLFNHFKRAIQILWPEIIWHKWNDLIVENYLKHRSIVILGPASSGKTNSAAFCLLMDYYCFPSETTGIVCSTTRDRLEDRVFGEIKKYHRLATQRYSWLPGHLIEGKQRIITDDRSQAEEGRDFRNGICFPKGTLVDTPSGSKKIEDIKVGDSVFNAVGVGTVTKTHKSYSNSLLRITLADGRILDCTKDHPIFTKEGWKKAIDLRTYDTVFSKDETLSFLRNPNSKESNILLSEMCQHEEMSWLRKEYRRWLSKPKVLLQRMSHQKTSKKVRSMWGNFSSREQKATLEECYSGQVYWPVLRQRMRGHLGIQTQGVFSEDKSAMRTMWENNERRTFSASFLLYRMSQKKKDYDMSFLWKNISCNERQTEFQLLKILQSPLQDGYSRTTLCSQAISRFDNGISSRKAIHRCCISQNKIGSRIRRFLSCNQGSEKNRCEKNTAITGTRVESITILESGSEQRFEESKAAYPVFNISVSGHPSYSVNGVIVHNCGVPCLTGGQFTGLSNFVGLKNKRVRLLGDELSMLPRAFCDSISNLDKNPDFKLIGLGNPKDTTDALGILAEPAASLGGWEGGIDQTPVTKTWQTRRTDGVCIQLVGTDSPNLDGKLGIPLITQEQIDRDVSFYGKDSIWFSMMDQGMMPRGQGSRRVITRQMCQKFGALNDPTWRSPNRTKIAGLDAAYRAVGGDRCIFVTMEFGEESITDETPFINQPVLNQDKSVNPNKVIIALTDVQIVPIKAGDFDQPEDQIVAFVRSQCENKVIPPENLFFDSGMRTSLVTAFSRLWSPNVNSVDCGGKPSERKVSEGIDVKACDYYSKKITEIWYAVRLCIESGQFRGMTEEVMMEFASREWTMVGANKIEVEPKEKMKLKIGRSPDLADAVAIAVYGALIRGFTIRSLTAKLAKQLDTRWKRELREQSEKLWRGNQLIYT